MINSKEFINFTALAGFRYANFQSLKNISKDKWLLTGSTVFSPKTVPNDIDYVVRYSDLDPEIYRVIEDQYKLYINTNRAKLSKEYLDGELFSIRIFQPFNTNKPELPINLIIVPDDREFSIWSMATAELLYRIKNYPHVNNRITEKFFRVGYFIALKDNFRNSLKDTKNWPDVITVEI